METELEYRVEFLRRWMFGNDAAISVKEQKEAVTKVMEYAVWLAERRRFLNQAKKYGDMMSADDKEFVSKIMKVLAESRKE